MKLIDGIISEPMGGAHRHREDTVNNVGQQIEAALKALTPWDSKALIKARREKYIACGRKL